MLCKWGLHIPDAAKKASMQMYSPLSSAIQYFMKSIAASSVLHLKLPALETSYIPKGDVFPLLGSFSQNNADW